MKRKILEVNELLKKQVDILFNSALSGGLSNVFSVWLIFTLVYDTKHHVNSLILSIVVTILMLVRTYVTGSYLKSSNRNINKYLSGYLLLTLSIGMAWGWFLLTQSSHSDDSVKNMIFLISFGLIAGGIPILSVWLPAYYVFVIPQAIAIFIVFISLDDAQHYYLALTFFIFISVMISTSINVNRSRKKEIELTFYNEQLIVDLNNEILIREEVQFQLENNKRKLEIKVEERTKDLIDINSNLEKVISKKEEAEESLQHLAYHDELTGLPNRNLLINRIDHSIEAAHRNKQQLGVLFLDLDRFKTINDSLGHIIGDKLIKQVSIRLLKTLRKEDTISRNGGDEFVVVIQRMINSDEAIGIAQKLIENLTSIFDIDSHKIHIGASVGISIFPNDGCSALELLRNADTAMYNAKKAGGNRLQFYDESMSNKLRERLEIENELHTAIANDEFYMAFQPQVNCLTGKTVGFEALLRWNNKELGAVSPVQFIPLLEETGLIYDVGKWVITYVTQFIASGHLSNVTVAINLSALQCGDMKFVSFIEKEIKNTGIDPSQLEFEITESLLIDDFEKTEIFLNKLHRIGCSIALDDFGTGYTSMSYLTRLPIDCIKVDQTFIRDIDTKSTLVNIVKSIVTMSTGLGMKNVFEGIETQAELDVVKNLNGEIVQGYLYSKPLDIDDIEQWLTKSHEVNAPYLIKQ
ncbi:MAG: EAL domain-containing protein [Gammaproteobacteria bacterium]|nr:EAL domain-containing protein [Gammaproteobacteria bacterium]